MYVTQDNLILAPTAEETFIKVMSENYKAKILHEGEVSAFQIAKKFRRERRCKGMLRTNEFIMKDAYVCTLKSSRSWG